MPISSSMSLSSSCPERPTNGRPCLSSSAPGPSPTNNRSDDGSPVPNTTCVRPSSASLHLVQPSASSRRISKRVGTPSGYPPVTWLWLPVGSPPAPGVNPPRPESVTPHVFLAYVDSRCSPAANWGSASVV